MGNGYIRVPILTAVINLNVETNISWQVHIFSSWCPQSYAELNINNYSRVSTYLVTSEFYRLTRASCCCRDYLLDSSHSKLFMTDADNFFYGASTIPRREPWPAPAPLPVLFLGPWGTMTMTTTAVVVVQYSPQKKQYSSSVQFLLTYYYGGPLLIGPNIVSKNG